MKKVICLTIGIIALLAASSQVSGKIIYVDDDAPVSSVEDGNGGVNDGSSWENAYTFLQDAIADAEAAEKPVEIRVAQGIYKPDQGLNQDAGDRWASFELVNDVILKGGYAGFGEPDPNVRNVELYETILSGDLEDNDIDVSAPYDLTDEPTRIDNSYNILTSLDSDIILDGFIISGGNGIHIGGGLLVTNGRSTIINCTFIQNSAQSGGAIYNENANLILSKCRFIENYAGSGGGILNFGDATLERCVFHGNLGSALYHVSNSGGLYGGKLELNDCLFSCNVAFFGGNSFGNGGGAVRAEISEEVVIRGCTFNSNIAYNGGALYTTGIVNILENCVFTGNAAIRGGTFYCSGNTTIKNCIFTGNRADNGAVLIGADSVSLECCTFADNLAQEGNIFASLRGRRGTPFLEMTVANSILWDYDNEFEEFVSSIAYSNIQGGWPGEENIDIDPLFAIPGYWIDVNDPHMIVETDNSYLVLIDGQYYLNYPRYRDEPVRIPIWVEGDYHLKSQAGRFDSNTQEWVQDDVTSPCIDAGDPMSPIGLEPFPNGGRINMGAYGGTAEASKSYFGEPLCETIVAGDINGDCKVDFADYAILSIHWLEENNP